MKNNRNSEDIVKQNIKYLYTKIKAVFLLDDWVVLSLLFIECQEG